MLVGPCLLRGPVHLPATAHSTSAQHEHLQGSCTATGQHATRQWRVPRTPSCRLISNIHAAAPEQTTDSEPAKASDPIYSVSQNKEYERAKNSAIGSLSLRPHSRKELVDKLIDKGYSQKAIDRALDRLKEVEVQSDADFADVYVRSKWRQSRWAPSRIQQELYRKGVGREDCMTALQNLFGESSRGRIRVNLDHAEDALTEEQSICGTEERVDQQLLGSARRQAEVTVTLPIEARRRRLVGWLQRRGHDWETISRVLALLQLK